MKTQIVRSALMGLVFCAFTFVASAEDIPVVIHENLVTKYQAALGTQKPGDIKNFTGMTRDLVELVLLMQAFEKSGIKDKVVFTTANSYDRIKVMVKNGDALMAGNLWWPDEIGNILDQVYLCTPLLPSGSTVWGVYGLADNVKLMSVKTRKDLVGLSALTDPSWTRDVEALIQLGVTIDGVKEWALLKKMLVGKRADLTLLPFASTPDMSLTWEGVKIFPVPGLKVMVPGARGFVLSKKFPHAEILFPALEKSIQAMLKSGAVEAAFQQAGFINDPRIKDWTALKID